MSPARSALACASRHWAHENARWPLARPQPTAPHSLAHSLGPAHCAAWNSKSACAAANPGPPTAYVRAMADRCHQRAKATLRAHRLMRSRLCAMRALRCGSQRAYATSRSNSLVGPKKKTGGDASQRAAKAISVRSICSISSRLGTLWNMPR